MRCGLPRGSTFCIEGLRFTLDKANGVFMMPALHMRRSRVGWEYDAAKAETEARSCRESTLFAAVASQLLHSNP